MPLTGLWHMMRSWCQLQVTTGTLSHGYSMCMCNMNSLDLISRTDADGEPEAAVGGTSLVPENQLFQHAYVCRNCEFMVENI